MAGLRLIFLSSLFLVYSSAYCQDLNKVDSLRNVLRGTKNDTTKVIALQHLFDSYLYSEPDSSLTFFRNMLSLSSERNFDWGLYQGHLYQATYYWSQSKFDSVITAMNKALVYAEKLNDFGKISNCYSRLAMAHSYLGNYTEAKNLTYKALEIAIENNDWEGLYYAYYRLGNTFYYENDFDNALINYLKVDSIFQHHERKEPALAASLSNIGQIYMEIGNYEKAEQYFVRSREQYRSQNRKEGEVYIRFNMGKLDFNRGRYNRCIDSLKVIRSYYENAKNLDEVSDISGWIGAAYLKLEDPDNAYTNYNYSVRLAEKTNNKMLLANGLVGLAEVSKSKKVYPVTIRRLEQALQLYDEMNVSYNKSQILNNLALAYKEEKNYELAYKYLEEFKALEDSITQIQNAENFQELETKYESEKKEKEIALLSAKNDIASQKNTNQRNLFLAGGSILGLGLVILFLLYNNRQKTARKLKELDSLKSHFFANISHEFRTPLTLINAPLEKKLGQQDLDDTERNELEMMERNSRRLLNLVDQLLDLSKLEAGKYHLNVKKGDLGALLRASAASFEYLASENDLNYIRQFHTLKEAWFDPDLIEKIMANLLSNAMKYTPKGGNVRVEAHEKKDNVLITVTNTIVPEQSKALERIFDRFYQANDHNEGAGIGLSLVNELVELANGRITLRPVEHNELHIAIELPVKESAFPAAFKKDSESKVRSGLRRAPLMEAPTELPDSVLEGDKEIMLIVEDQVEIRNLLKKTFSGQYQILAAENGETGMEKALSTIPDIIISDIMMPGIDGLELCQGLKNDERTSHIPIILLTARAGEENQYKGLTAGADAYVTKPFTIKLLEARVDKLLESRRKLRKRYSQEVILKPKDIAISSLDEQFLTKVQEVLDRKLTEPGFSVQEFSEAAGMSRMQLHRKLKALTNLSASEFIRSQRLKLAASLLRSSEVNVTQIGYEVGFNDPSYFSKCFKEAYGVTPTEYTKKSS